MQSLRAKARRHSNYGTSSIGEWEFLASAVVVEKEGNCCRLSGRFSKMNRDFSCRTIVIERQHHCGAAYYCGLISPARSISGPERGAKPTNGGGIQWLRTKQIWTNTARMSSRYLRKALGDVAWRGYLSIL